jgi:class 3 adenylate cyclase
MRWELLCPACRGVKASATHLRDVSSGGFCPACNLHFVASVDEALEARFYPAPSVRAVELGVYCVGSPMTTPHRLAQSRLEPGAENVWRLTLTPGTYSLISPQCRGRVVLDAVDGAPDQAAIRLEAAGMAPEEIQVTAGCVGLTLANATGTSVTVSLDDAGWAAMGATPGQLMTLPAFQAQFSSEALAPGVELAVRRVGLLFTDLAASTALYERVGEARAFRLVGEHFALVRGVVEAAGGAVIKTIGDAVMAAFPDGRAALAAALAVQRAIRTLDTRGLVDTGRLLKVGVHAGACYAVTLNDRLDYFGTAVNLASRAQHEARGGDVVVTAAVWEEARAALGTGLVAEPFEVRLRGLAAPVRLYRVASRQSPVAGGKET